MKAIIISLALLLAAQTASLACTVCKSQQPKILQGISHGVPQSNWDYVIVSLTAFIAIATLVISLKQLVRPGERNSDHIKRSILNSNYE